MNKYLLSLRPEDVGVSALRHKQNSLFRIIDKIEQIFKKILLRNIMINKKEDFATFSGKLMK